MKCPKCGALMFYDQSRHADDIASAKCLICGYRIWEPVKITKAIPEPVAVAALTPEQRRNQGYRMKSKLKILRQQEAGLEH